MMHLCKISAATFVLALLAGGLHQASGQESLPGHKLSINGTQIYYEVRGDGPPLLLLRYFGGCGQVWQPFVERLARHYRIPGVEPPRQQPRFQRGRLDRFALNASSEEAFRERRRRIIAAGASDGVVTDMGSLLLFSFLDPDQGRHEVVCKKPGVPIAAVLKRAGWTTVELD